MSKQERSKLGTLTTLVMLVLLVNPATAQEADLLDTLLQNGAITQEQYVQLKRQQNAEAQEPPSAAPVVGDDPQEVVVTARGGLRGRSPDGAFSYELGGRVVVDLAAYDEDVLQDLGNGSKLRRVRVDVEGNVWTDWGYQVELDFAEDEVEIKDTFLQYDGFENFRLRLGHLKEPFSLEEQTSSLYNTFMERALPNALAPDRSVGLTMRTYGDHWSFLAGAFGEGVDDSNSGDGELDEGTGISGRFAITPISKERTLIHFGASASIRKAGDDKEYRVRARPESNVTNVRFVNTGNIDDVDERTTLGVEAAAIFGPFSLQGEYITQELTIEGAEPGMLEFDGYYAYVSWFLTGESRSFRNTVREFGRIRPKRIVGRGGAGAWELALRASNLDLTDGDFDGGKEDNITLGLNWYPTPNIRVLFNYITVDAEMEGIRDEPNIYQMRAQIHF